MKGYADPQTVEKLRIQNSHRVPSEAAINTIRNIRQACFDLALTIAEQLPHGRERSLALTKVDEARMWACSAAVDGGEIKEPLSDEPFKPMLPENIDEAFKDLAKRLQTLEEQSPSEPAEAEALEKIAQDLRGELKSILEEYKAEVEKSIGELESLIGNATDPGDAGEGDSETESGEGDQQPETKPKATKKS